MYSSCRFFDFFLIGFGIYVFVEWADGLSDRLATGKAQYLATDHKGVRKIAQRGIVIIMNLNLPSLPPRPSAIHDKRSSFACVIGQAKFSSITSATFLVCNVSFTMPYLILLLISALVTCLRMGCVNYFPSAVDRTTARNIDQRSFHPLPGPPLGGRKRIRGFRASILMRGLGNGRLFLFSTTSASECRDDLKKSKIILANNAKWKTRRTKGKLGPEWKRGRSWTLMDSVVLRLRLGLYSVQSH